MVEGRFSDKPNAEGPRPSAYKHRIFNRYNRVIFIRPQRPKLTKTEDYIKFQYFPIFPSPPSLYERNDPRSARRCRGSLSMALHCLEASPSQLCKQKSGSARMQVNGSKFTKNVHIMLRKGNRPPAHSSAERYGHWFRNPGRRSVLSVHVRRKKRQRESLTRKLQILMGRRSALHIRLELVMTNQDPRGRPEDKFEAQELPTPWRDSSSKSSGSRWTLPTMSNTIICNQQELGRVGQDVPEVSCDFSSKYLHDRTPLDPHREKRGNRRLEHCRGGYVLI